MFATQMSGAVRDDAGGAVEPVARAVEDLDQGAGRGRELGHRIARRVRHPDMGAARSYGRRVAELVARAAYDFDQAPVEAESSVTEFPGEFATQRWAPAEMRPREPLNP